MHSTPAHKERREHGTERKENWGENVKECPHNYRQKVVEESVKTIKRNESEWKRKIYNIKEVREYIRYKR